MSKPKIVLNKKFRPLISSPARYFIVSGGRGAAKSFSVTTYLVLKTLEEGNTILFARYTMVSAEISVIPEFRERLENMGIAHLYHITRTEIINRITGSRIVFRGLKTGSRIQTANLKSIANLNIIVIDEAEEIPTEEIFDKVDLSARELDRDNKVILIFNPTTKKHWLYDRWFLKEGIEAGSNLTKGIITYIHTSYLDNLKNLDSIFIGILDKLKITDPKKYNNIVLGHFLDTSDGVVFNNWELGEFPKEYIDESEFFIDFGFSKDPTALGRAYLDRKRMVVYIREEVYNTGIIPSELAQIVKHKVGRSLVVADNADPATIAEIKNVGVNIKGIKKPRIVERIEIMKGYKFIVDPKSKNFIDELNNYTWDVNYEYGERPIDNFNHCFTGHTLIDTSTGLKPIRKVNERDMVHTSKGVRKVLKRFENGLKEVNRYSIITSEGEIVLEATPNHKIKTNKGWIEIQKLQKGLKVYLKDSTLKEPKPVQEVVVENIVVEPLGSLEVFDLMVEGQHEYFANGLLVHNCLDGLGYYIIEKHREPEKRRRYSIY